MTLSERKRRDGEAETRNHSIQQQIEHYKEKLRGKIKGEVIGFLQEIHTLVFRQVQTTILPLYITVCNV